MREILYVSGFGITPISIFPHQGGRGGMVKMDSRLRGNKGGWMGDERGWRKGTLTPTLSQDGRGGRREGG